MLAYVFWHWKRADVERPHYEALQRDFHAALAGAPSLGLITSRSTAIYGAGWAAQAGEAYEDWYLLDDSGALDALNDAAVTASRRLPHDAAASAADGGVAGLYRLRDGSALAAPRHAYWFAKPPGMRYPAFDALLAPVVDAANGALWARQMVLGIAPEFCLHARDPVQLPHTVMSCEVTLRAVWP